MNNDNTAISIEDVCFSYQTASKERIIPLLPIHRVTVKTHQALKSINLQIRRNRITTLLGKNGSGKTTLIRLICGARLPNSGKVTVLGQEPRFIKHRLGLFMGNTLIYHRLTARENLEYFAKLYGVEDIPKRISEMAEIMGLTPHINQLVESFSFGMKVKLGLARAMIHKPDILILDEPTLGIDLHLAKQIREFVRNLNCTVLLTTHYMEEAEMLSDDICLIDGGKLITSGEKQAVFETYQAKSVPELFTNVINSQPKLASL